MSFIDNLKPDHLPARFKNKNELAVQREIILQYILLAISFLGLVGFGVYLVSGGYKDVVITALFGSAIAWMVLITIYRDLPYSVRATTLILVVFIEALSTLSRNGLEGNGTLNSLTFALLAGILFGGRVGLGAFIGMVLINSVVGYFMVTGQLPIPVETGMSVSANLSNWIANVIALIFSGASLTGAIYQITQGLTKSLSDQKKLSQDVEKERSLLEKRIAERTSDLIMKAAQLEASRRVASKIAAESEIDTILTVAVDVIREQFNFYHAGIFLLDKAGEKAILTSATGESGRKMLERGYTLQVSEESMVGFAILHSESRISGNVDQDPVHYRNPLLPDTRSEMTVPLIIANQVIGVLDVQSSIRNAFTGDDIEIISTLANQVAFALDRARLMEKLKLSFSELEEVQRQTTQIAWQKHLKNSRRHFAYQYKLSQVGVLENTVSKVEKRADKNQPEIQIPHEVVIQSANSADGNIAGSTPTSSMIVPIKLRNQVLGTVKLRFSSPTISEDMAHLVEGAIERLALSLENARLVEEIQTRAERDRMVGDIANKVRSVTDVESILRIAAGELGHSLGVSEVVVQLTAKD
jgi:GAF domain-containing protein